MSHPTKNSARLTRFDKTAIDPESPWEDNLVPEREILAKTLTRYLSACGGPYVLSISSPWGTGKSDFLERWDKWLQKSSEPKSICFRFNAWEHDFSDNPFLAFAAALDKFIKDNPPATWAEFRKPANAVARALISVGRYALFPVVKKTSRALVSGYMTAHGADNQTAAIAGGVAEAGAEVFEMTAQELLNKLTKAGESRSDVTDKLQTFGLTVQSKYKAPLIIMIDELDRCKPIFAIALLEAIKHLFCVPGVVFVLAIETKQLSNCIAKIYGLEEAGARAYLHKFVDMDIPLPSMDKHTFVCKNFEKPSFPLGLPDQQTQICSDRNSSNPSFVLSDWIAAIISDILPSYREALQVMNQISVLSFKPDMDFISLLVCAYALSYRIANYSSIESAIESTFRYNRTAIKETLNPSQENIIFQYRNLFYSLIKSRSISKGEQPFHLKSIIQKDYFLMDGKALLSNFPTIFTFCKFDEDGSGERYFSWSIPYGEIWRKYLVECLYFVDSTAIHKALAVR